LENVMGMKLLGVVAITGLIAVLTGFGSAAHGQPPRTTRLLSSTSCHAPSHLLAACRARPVQDEKVSGRRKAAALIEEAQSSVATPADIYEDLT
jgi:hypothetical protein